MKNNIFILMSVTGKIYLAKFNYKMWIALGQPLEVRRIIYLQSRDSRYHNSHDRCTQTKPETKSQNYQFKLNLDRKYFSIF